MPYFFYKILNYEMLISNFYTSTQYDNTTVPVKKLDAMTPYPTNRSLYPKDIYC